MSVPNQKIVRIHKQRYKDNFLQIGKDEWLEAFNSMSPTTFKLYLYLSGNSDKFNLELSQVAVENAIGLSRASYHRGISALLELGYLVKVGGNIYAFYTSPQKTNLFNQNWEYSELRKSQNRTETDLSQDGEISVQNGDDDASELNIEIDKEIIRNKIDNSNSEMRLSYLEEKVFCDGFLVDKDIWIDNVLGRYWELSKEEIKQLIAEHYDDFGFTYDEADYIVENILDFNDYNMEDNNYA